MRITLKSMILILALFLSIGIKAQNTIKIDAKDSPAIIIEKAASVLPSKNQYHYKKLEFACFVHFGVNTYTAKEWGSGFENPAIFNPTGLDTDQWCEAMKAAGMKIVVITAKHHDGFVLWQSRYTKHGIMSSPHKNGEGDVLKDLSASCKKYGIKLGVYLSPADLYQIESPEGLYGNLSKYTKRTIPRPVEGRPFKNKTRFQFMVDDYNEYFLNQLFELLTEYGPIHEVWFDGAHPKRKGGQTYNYLAWKELIHTLAPEAVVFGKEDVRWCGNEAGRTRESEWDVIPFQQDPNLKAMFADLQGNPGTEEKILKAKFLHFLPAETNTSIREGWFYRDEEQGVRSADDVFDIYERSVGGNTNFLLNIPPNREGKFSPRDVDVLVETGKRIRKTYSHNLLKNAKGPKDVLDGDEETYFLADDKQAEIVIETGKPVVSNRFMLQEAIRFKGQRIIKHALDALIDGEWKQIAEGTTVGYKKILRFEDVETNTFRLRILDARDHPSILEVAAFYYQHPVPSLSIQRNSEGMVSIKPEMPGFKWKSHGEDFLKNLGAQLEIRYTTNDSKPDENAKLYQEPFFLKSGLVQAQAGIKDQMGSVSKKEFGVLKSNWKVFETSREGDFMENAFDQNIHTIWTSEEGLGAFAIDMGNVHATYALVYTPPLNRSEELIAEGMVFISVDGKTWKEAAKFKLGNIVNDPSPRKILFHEVFEARYIKLTEIKSSRSNGKISISELDVLVK